MTESALLPPTLAGGRYELGRFLGEGARKRVYLARDQVLDRDVAVSVILTGALDQAGRDRIIGEARATARLGTHPGIVTVHDLGEQDDIAYIVSEHMARGSVADLLAETPGRPLDHDLALRLAGEVCGALAHAHRAGIVHRDVKPANVFLNEDGHARLGDFGVALALDRARLTSEGMVGTADYMPPEQALGSPVDARSDLYSLGAMLYEMVCGRPPFAGDNVVAVVSQHINSPPVAPSWHDPTISAGLDALILRLLAKAPEDRPGSADDVRAALAELAARPAPERAGEAPNPLGRLAQGGYVGRRGELERLRALTDDAIAGRGGLALLVGEPGIGKTRTAEELAAYAGLRGAHVVWGRCYEGEGAPPYWPWVQVLRGLLEHARPDEATGAAIARVVPEAGDAAPAPPGETPEQARFRLFDAVGRYLDAAARDRPLVIVLDDLHWADAPSILLLAALARDVRDAPILLVGTYRDAEVGRDHPLAGVELGGEQIVFSGLAAGDVARFIEARTGAPPADALARAAFERTDGNPFFLAEVVRLLVSEGESVAVPQGVKDVIAHRLERLSDDARAALVTAAVIGRDFGLDVLQRASDLDADALLDALDEAAGAQVIAPLGTAGRFRFSHALVRDVIGDELGTLRRARVHLAVAQALEALHARALEPQVAALAHHYAEALPLAGPDLAVDYAEAAARRSHDQLAYEEAARHYDRACRVLELAGRADDPRRIELLVARGEEEVHVGEVEASMTTFREAAELAHAQGSAELLARAALGFAQWSVLGPSDPAIGLLERALEALPETDSALRAEVLAELGIHLDAAEHAERKDALSGEAVAMGRRVGDRTKLALLVALRHAAIWGPGNLTERLALADEALELAEEAGDASRVRWAHFLRFVNRLEAGDVATADRALDEFARVADELGQPYHRWYAAFMRRTRALMDGRGRDAARLAEELPGLWHSDDDDDAWAITVQDLPLRWHEGRLGEVGDEVQAAVERYATVPAYRALLAWVAAERGRGDEARRELDRLLAEDLAALPRDSQWLAAVASLACAAVALGDERHVDALAAALEPYADRLVLFDAGWACLGPAARHLGVLHALRGDWDAAAARLEEALATAERLGARPWAAQARHDLARALVAQGEPERARELVADGLAASRELGLHGLVDRFLAVQRVAGGGPPPPPPGASAVEAMAMTIEAAEPGPGPEAPVTLLFSDIEGSTRLNDELGDVRWLEILEEHNAIVRRACAAHRGLEVKSAGDGFMLAFDRPGDGLACAVALQRGLAERDAAGADCPLRVRIGVHTGPAIRRGRDFFGRNVVIAARVADKATGGEILVTQDLLDLAGADGAGEARDLELKGLQGTQRVRPIAWA